MDKHTLRQRGLRRIAHVLHDFWEEARAVSPTSQSGHTGIYDFLLNDEYMRLGRSRSLTPGAQTQNEHLVPRKKLRNMAYDIFDRAGGGEAGIAQVTAMLDRCLRKALIEKEKAQQIDGSKRNGGLGLKDDMPPGWDPDTGCVLARLTAAKVELEWTELRYVEPANA